MLAKAIPTATAALALLAGCGGTDEGSGARPEASTLPKSTEPVELDPADFTTEIDNPYWPMRPGSRWVYRETDGEGGEQRVVVTVTDRTRKLANGVTARVVRDTVTEKGALVEDTFDWYAQDAQGNVWYLGEATKEYENGRVKTTAGSWEAGVDGGEAGVIMPAAPEVGLRYRQEYLPGEAEDRGAILSVDEQAEVRFGHFDDVLLTKDYTPVEPKVLEYKLYARGVGPVLVFGVSGGGGTEELLRYER
jgi:hypothetical protein